MKIRPNNRGLVPEYHSTTDRAHSDQCCSPDCCSRTDTGGVSTAAHRVQRTGTLVRNVPVVGLAPACGGRPSPGRGWFHPEGARPVLNYLRYELVVRDF